jgi:hypothetical protein
MAEHHKEVAGYSAAACVRCHPNGNKQDD